MGHDCILLLLYTFKYVNKIILYWRGPQSLFYSSRGPWPQKVGEHQWKTVTRNSLCGTAGQKGRAALNLQTKNMAVSGRNYVPLVIFFWPLAAPLAVCKLLICQFIYLFIYLLLIFYFIYQFIYYLYPCVRTQYWMMQLRNVVLNPRQTKQRNVRQKRNQIQAGSKRHKQDKLGKAGRRKSNKQKQVKDEKYTSGLYIHTDRR